jgi:simple sugar transport system ATP-binding protein
VLRNGKLVGEYETSSIPQIELIAKMLGNELEDITKLKKHEPVVSESSTPVFESKGLSSAAGVRPFDFTIQKGEVNGFAGLLGSGRSESVRAIFAADKVTGGEVRMKGKQVKIKSPLHAIKQGIGYLPEDRKDDGIIYDLSVRDNIVLTLQVLKGFFTPFSLKQAQAFADEDIEKLNIKTPTANTPIKSLSGGNQQKVILARWLLTHPEYLILDEPTRGIDVGTKVEIQKLVLKLASEGMSLTFISSEIEEMLRTCSRLIVMKDREIVAELRGTELTENDVMNVIAQGGKTTCAN